MFTGFQPGDCLLYGSKDFFGWVTSIKTWSPAVHVEVYAGNGESVASRNGIGVNIYPLRTEQLIAVLRPNQKVDLLKGMVWFYRSAIGLKYDWLDLLQFYRIVKHGAKNRMICSEFATEFYRACGFNPFNPYYDSGKISPADFLISDAFETIWKNFQN